MKTATAAHTAEIKAVHEEILMGSSARNRFIKTRTGRVHLIEAGDGPPVLLFNGSGPSALHMLPLLEKVERAWTIVVDRPGFGLSDPADVTKKDFRRAAEEFVEGVMDALGVDRAVVGGNSMGGTIATWYALARPERVRGLILIGAAPLFPGTSVPGMLRLVVSPIGTLLGKLMKPTPKLVVQNMKAFGEGETITRYPELINAQVVAGEDKAYANASTGELQTIISVRGFRSGFLLSDADLEGIPCPTQIIWGTNDPLGGTDVAKRIAGAISDCRLEILDAGHGPWFGHPEKVAKTICEFATQDSPTTSPLRPSSTHGSRHSSSDAV